MVEDRRVCRPVLVELRGELDEVARDAGSGEAGIFAVGEHAVQGVAELVEHRGDVVEADQRGLAGGGLRQIGDVVDDGQCAEQLRLIDEVAHPGAAVLVVALEVVAVEERERLAVGVEDFEDAHVGLIDRHVVALLESDAVELVGGVEDAVLQDVVEFEVWLDLGFVEVVLRLADLLGVEIPVPGLQLKSAVLCVDDGLDIFAFAVRPWRSRRAQVASMNFSAASGVLAIWSSSFQAA